MNTVGGVIAILLIWLGAVMVAKQFFAPEYTLWPVAILGWIGTLWVFKNTKL